MLSPNMSTKSNGKRAWYFTICRPTSNCALSPVPLSPITAKRTDLGLSGSFSSGSGAWAHPAAASIRPGKTRIIERRRMVLLHTAKGAARAANDVSNQIAPLSPSCACFPFSQARDILWDRALDEVDNHIRLRVAKNQVMAHDA